MSTELSLVLSSLCMVCERRSKHPGAEESALRQQSALCKKVQFTSFPLRTPYNCGILPAIKSCIMSRRRSGLRLKCTNGGTSTRPEYQRGACWVKANVSPSRYNSHAMYSRMSLIGETTSFELNALSRSRDRFDLISHTHKL